MPRTLSEALNTAIAALVCNGRLAHAVNSRRVVVVDMAFFPWFMNLLMGLRNLSFERLRTRLVQVRGTRNGVCYGKTATLS